MKVSAMELFECRNMKKYFSIISANYSDSVPSAVNIQINGLSLKRVASAKYLRLVYDQNMKWETRINEKLPLTRELSIGYSAKKL